MQKSEFGKMVFMKSPKKKLDKPLTLHDFEQGIRTFFSVAITEALKPVMQSIDDLALATARGFEEVRADIRELQYDVRQLKQDVSVLKVDVNLLKVDVSVLKQDVAVLKQDVTVLKQDVSVLKTDMTTMAERMGTVESFVSSNRIDRLEDDMKVVKLHLKLQ